MPWTHCYSRLRVLALMLLAGLPQGCSVPLLHPAPDRASGQQLTLHDQDGKTVVEDGLLVLNRPDSGTPKNSASLLEIRHGTVDMPVRWHIATRYVGFEGVLPFWTGDSFRIELYVFVRGYWFQKETLTEGQKSITLSRDDKNPSLASKQWQLNSLGIRPSDQPPIPDKTNVVLSKEDCQRLVNFTTIERARLGLLASGGSPASQPP